MMDTEAMEESIYIDDARRWVRDYVQENKRVEIIAAVLFVVGTLVIVIPILAWLIIAAQYSWLSLGFIVAYTGVQIAFGKYTFGKVGYQERPTVETVFDKDRHGGHWTNVNSGDENVNGFGVLMLPITTPIAAMKCLHRYRELKAVDVDVTAKVLAVIAQRQKSVEVEELVLEYGIEEMDLAVDGLLDIEPVIWLAEPNRISLAPSAIRAIRGEAA